MRDCSKKNSNIRDWDPCTTIRNEQSSGGVSVPGLCRRSRWQTNSDGGIDDDRKSSNRSSDDGVDSRAIEVSDSDFGADRVQFGFCEFYFFETWN